MLRFVAEKFAFVVVLTSVNVEMRERLFFNTFLRRKCFFASNVIWYHFGQILKSEVIFLFLNARLVISGCPADCLVFFLW